MQRVDGRGGQDSEEWEKEKRKKKGRRQGGKRREKKVETEEFVRDMEEERAE